MQNTVKNGAILLDVTTETCVNIATLEPNSNFILKSTNLQNATTCKPIAIAQEDRFAPLLMEILKWREIMGNIRYKWRLFFNTLKHVISFCFL